MTSEGFQGTDRLLIRRSIGSGSFGMVFEAFDHHRQGVVALKTLTHMGPEALLQFKREFRALADLSHPNLVRVPERLISVSFVAFARDERITLDNGFASLRPWRVAFIQGWKMYEAEAAGARVVHRVDQAEQLFRMLDHDRIDLALYTLADGQALARHLGLARVRAIVPSLADADMYLYLNRRHEALVPRLAQALRDMKSDGTHARLLAAIGAP